MSSDTLVSLLPRCVVCGVEYKEGYTGYALRRAMANGHALRERNGHAWRWRITEAGEEFLTTPSVEGVS